MKYVFDIDGTICTNTMGQYEKAQPIKERIDKINQMYDEGNIIVFHTARGMGRSGNDFLWANELFYDFTKGQLESWQVKYHYLFMGKPAGDVYIDDKGIKDDDFFADDICP